MCIIYKGCYVVKYKIADVVFETNHIYKYTPWLCKKYVYSGNQPTDCVIEITKNDILIEKQNAGDEDFPDFYLESLALYRKLCSYILNHANGTLFHSSSLAVDGKGYLFTAPSGTGKSTHARLWRETFGDRVITINDDKPIVRCIDGIYYVYGTPWNGKHGLDNDIRVPISAICEIYQSKENKIEKVTPTDMLMVAFSQTLRPTEKSAMDKYLTFIDGLLKSVNLYKLGCNISVDAAKLSFSTMVEKGNK